MIKDHTKCRVCGATKLTEYLDLGYLPLSNKLQDTHDQVVPKFPLRLALCQTCGLSQLLHVIDPDILFGNYVYRSGISDSYREHCTRMAQDLADKRPELKDGYHIDIAGNDGTLLKEFSKSWGHRILNVDPAANLGEIARADGVPTFERFWSEQVGHAISNGSGYGQADLITATNVFAHIDDVYDFMRGINYALKPDGILVLEFPYIMDFIEKNEFDTVYFEHLSYFSICPLKMLCDNMGLVLLDVAHLDIHGGSVRCIIGKHGKPDMNVAKFMKMERMLGFHYLKTYTDWAEKVRQIINKFATYISALSAEHKVCGFAASAKGNTLLNCAGITHREMNYIVDQTPEKIGKYSPGTGIPIVPMEILKLDPPDFLVLLAWNFDKEIINKCHKAGYKGKFIYPLTLGIL